MTLARDVRLTLRGALTERAYAAAVIATLALTIGANTAIFSAVYAVLLSPLPISRPEELLICWGSDPAHHLAVVELSYKNFEEWAANSRSFARTAAVGSSTWPGVLEGRGEPVKVSTAGVSAAFFDTLTMEAIVDRATAPWRFSVWMFSLFAALAFALATFGLFSAVSLDTARRRQEFAIRLALGASRRHVVRQVLLAVGCKVLVGVTFGVACAAAGTRAIRSILFGVGPLDTGTYAGVMMLIAVVGLLAAYVPARRAARADPLMLLRRGD